MFVKLCFRLSEFFNNLAFSEFSRAAKPQLKRLEKAMKVQMYAKIDRGFWEQPGGDMDKEFIYRVPIQTYTKFTRITMENVDDGHYKIMLNQLMGMLCGSFIAILDEIQATGKVLVVRQFPTFSISREGTTGDLIVGVYTRFVGVPKEYVEAKTEDVQ